MVGQNWPLWVEFSPMRSDLGQYVSCSIRSNFMLDTILIMDCIMIDTTMVMVSIRLNTTLSNGTYHKRYHGQYVSRSI